MSSPLKVLRKIMGDRQGTETRGIPCADQLFRSIFRSMPERPQGPPKMNAQEITSLVEQYFDSPKEHKKEAAKLVDSLVKAIETANYQYFVLDKPTVSDYDFDLLVKALENLEAAFPEFRRKDSPTYR